MEFLVLASENIFINKEKVDKGSSFNITAAEDGLYKCNGIICDISFIIKMINYEDNDINRIIINHNYKDISNLLITLDYVFKLALPIEDAEVQSIVYGYSHHNPPKEEMIFANENCNNINFGDNKSRANTTLIVTKRNPNNIDIDSNILYEKIFNKCVIIRNVDYDRYSNPKEVHELRDKFFKNMTDDADIVDNIGFIKLNSEIGLDLKHIQKSYPSIYEKELEYRCKYIIKLLAKYIEQSSRVFIDYHIKIDNKLTDLVKQEADKKNLNYTNRHYF